MRISCGTVSVWHVKQNYESQVWKDTIFHHNYCTVLSWKRCRIEKLQISPSYELPIDPVIHNLDWSVMFLSCIVSKKGWYNSCV